MVEGRNRRQALGWMAKGVAGGLAGTGALALSACGPKKPPLRPNLIIWHGFRGAEKASLEKLATIYSGRLKPGQRPVRAVAIPSDAMADKISASVPRGKGPDLFIFGHDRLGGWAEVGDTITPLDFFLDEATKAAFLPHMFEAVTYKNAVWALPFNYKSAALLYNKKLVAKPPETVEEMQDLAIKLTDQARGRFGLAYAYDDFFFHAALMNGYGGGVFDATGKLMLDDPRNIAASDLVQYWRRDLGILPDDPTSSLVASLFNTGRAAMIFNGPWFLGEIAPEIEYGAAVLPRITAANNRPMAPYLAVEAIFMSAGTHDPAEAWAFAKFLTSVEAAKIMAVEGGELPTLRAVYDVPEVAQNPIAQAYKTQALSAVAMPNLPEMTMVWSPADKAMKRVTKLETTSEAAWQDCQREVQAAILALRDGKAS
ncbi:extracellular solute-binding protein [Aquidulcibacter paucihalophilus]|uniref:extracellular solute-binding protein n=1 Tax=Aquidulcibacter paucihalophilus TaxID=1978549 RepID=UPI0012FFBDE9|nr:extracellular solute-binding protein [Aquidulcibacter paucihalophilus]